MINFPVCLLRATWGRKYKKKKYKENTFLIRTLLSPELSIKSTFLKYLVNY